MFGHGLVFERQIDKAAYVSLGPARWCALAWPLTTKKIDGAAFYLLSASASPQFVYTFSIDGSQWQGVPTSFRAPIDAPGTAPALMWMATGPSAPLLEFGLQEGVHLLKEHIIALCTDKKAPVVKLPGEKSLTIRSYATALVNHVLPHEPQGTRQKMIDALCGTRSKESVGHTKGDLVLEALKTIAPEDTCKRARHVCMWAVGSNVTNPCRRWFRFENARDRPDEWQPAASTTPLVSWGLTHSTVS